MNKLRLVFTGSTLSLLALCGCASKYVQATLRNQTGGAITLVEVDYPSASFGTETLADGAVYHYRFKIQGDGPTKVLWTDAAQKQHEISGPKLEEGQQGAFILTLMPTGVNWDTKLTR